MYQSMNAAGFSNVLDEKLLDELVTEVFENPSYTYAKGYGGDQIFGEYYKEYGKQTYVLVTVVIDRDAKGSPEVTIDSCQPYVKSEYTLEVENLRVEGTLDDFVYYVAIEDKKTGIELYFFLQNVVEMLDEDEDGELRYDGVHVVGVSTEGTIVLPIEKSREDREYEEKQRKYLRDVLRKHNEGDEESMEILKKEELQERGDRRARLEDEDLLTILDNYFRPTHEMEANYYLMGTITEMEYRENDITQEELCWLRLDINGMDLEIIINTNDLVGMPSIGMRFKGSCRTQGTINFI